MQEMHSDGLVMNYIPLDVNKAGNHPATPNSPTSRCPYKWNRLASANDQRPAEKGIITAVMNWVPFSPGSVFWRRTGCYCYFPWSLLAFKNFVLRLSLSFAWVKYWRVWISVAGHGQKLPACLTYLPATSQRLPRQLLGYCPWDYPNRNFSQSQLLESSGSMQLSAFMSFKRCLFNLR